VDVPFRALADRILREGPVRFDVAVEVLLYGDGGFFATAGGAGRRADFITSPEVGPLFGAVVARAIDDEWERLRRPDPFVVVEAGAGRGALARAVLDAVPACLAALRYVCVERSAVLRARADELLPVEPASNVFGSTAASDDPDDTQLVTGAGPVVAVLDDLPLVAVPGVVLANELLDNLPFRLVERRDDGWQEVLVGLAGDGEGLVEVLVDAPPAVAAEADRLAPDAPAGGRLPLQHEAAVWLRRALGTIERGRLVVIDYADTSASLAARPWSEWLRTYRGHGRGGHPLDSPGEQDVTCEVAVDQLARVHAPDSDRSQVDWLRAHGVDELVAAARVAWHERAPVGDLEALKARSRVGEGDALTDTGGLGAFRVLEWVVD
jgi:SAM-dependent MidA family methyltransferase